MFEGDSADKCASKFLFMSMGGRFEGLACANPGARTPMGASGNRPIPCKIFGPEHVLHTLSFKMNFNVNSRKSVIFIPNLIRYSKT